jgi:kynurenine formamidase
MKKLIDLTYTMRNHFRWNIDQELASDFKDGKQFQITRVGFGVHGFTHVDMPRHILPDGPTTDQLSLDRIVGDCAVIDLSGIQPKSEITEDQLKGAGSHIQSGDIVLLKTAWDNRYSIDTPEFWLQAPYMSREAARWLLSKEIGAIAFDFPQDYPIRLLLTDETASLDEFVTHDVLLRNGVILIEYVCNTAEVSGQRIYLCILPLKIPNSDGAPARVIAMI